ncbi:MAG: FtsH protease activity modulator HflK [Sphingobium sp.]|nr:FtsH protease activity modulator HflK [Sphingobium sp.]
MDRTDQTNTPPRIATNEGGPWGGQDEDTPPRGKGGPRNPWTPPSPDDGGRGPDRGPSAFDELFRRARDSFGGGLGGQPGGGKIWILLIGVIILGWIGLTSFHSVGQRQRGVVSFLGSYSRTLEPGMNMTLPAPFETVRVIEAEEIRTIDLGSAGEEAEKLVLTGDQNIINLGYSVRWNVSNPRQFAFQLAQPEETIKQVAESAMRGVIANVALNEAMGPGRRAIEQQVQQRMQDILDSYGVGIRIQGVAIKQADPPAEVINAFKDVTAAQQDADTDINRANAYAQQRSSLSQGEAAAFDKVYEQYKMAPEVTRRRLYYETMEAILGNMSKTVIETNGVAPYMQLPPPGAPRPATDQAAGGAK